MGFYFPSNDRYDYKKIAEEKVKERFQTVDVKKTNFNFGDNEDLIKEATQRISSRMDLTFNPPTVETTPYIEAPSRLAPSLRVPYNDPRFNTLSPTMEKLRMPEREPTNLFTRQDLVKDLGYDKRDLADPNWNRPPARQQEQRQAPEPRHYDTRDDTRLTAGLAPYLNRQGYEPPTRATTTRGGDTEPDKRYPTLDTRLTSGIEQYLDRPEEYRPTEPYSFENEKPIQSYRVGRKAIERMEEADKLRQGKPNRFYEVDREYQQMVEDLGEVGLLSQTTQMAPYQFETMKAGVLPFLSGGLTGALAAGVAGQLGPQALAPEELLTMPGAFFGFGRAAAAGAVAERSRELMTGGAYADLLAQGVSREEANRVASIVGAANALIEATQMGEIVGGALTAGLSAAGKKAIQSNLTGQGKNLMAEYAKSVGFETLEEMLQEAVTIGGERYTQGEGYSGGKFAEDASRVLATGAQAAPSLALMQGATMGAGSLAGRALTPAGIPYSERSPLTEMYMQGDGQYSQRPPGPLGEMYLGGQGESTQIPTGIRADRETRLTPAGEEGGFTPIPTRDITAETRGKDFVPLENAWFGDVDQHADAVRERILGIDPQGEFETGSLDRFVGDLSRAVLLEDAQPGLRNIRAFRADEADGYGTVPGDRTTTLESGSRLIQEMAEESGLPENEVQKALFDFIEETYEKSDGRYIDGMEKDFGVAVAEAAKNDPEFDPARELSERLAERMKTYMVLNYDKTLNLENLERKRRGLSYKYNDSGRYAGDPKYAATSFAKDLLAFENNQTRKTSKLNKLRAYEAKADATGGVVKGQRRTNLNTNSKLIKEISTDTGLAPAKVQEALADFVDSLETIDNDAPGSVYKAFEDAMTKHMIQEAQKGERRPRTETRTINAYEQTGDLTPQLSAETTETMTAVPDFGIQGLSPAQQELGQILAQWDDNTTFNTVEEAFQQERLLKRAEQILNGAPEAEEYLKRWSEANRAIEQDKLINPQEYTNQEYDQTDSQMAVEIANDSIRRVTAPKLSTDMFTNRNLSPQGSVINRILNQHVEELVETTEETAPVPVEEESIFGPLAETTPEARPQGRGMSRVLAEIIENDQFDLRAFMTANDTTFFNKYGVKRSFELSTLREGELLFEALKPTLEYAMTHDKTIEQLSPKKNDQGDIIPFSSPLFDANDDVGQFVNLDNTTLDRIFERYLSEDPGKLLENRKKLAQDASLALKKKLTEYVLGGAAEKIKHIPAARRLLVEFGEGIDFENEVAKEMYEEHRNFLDIKAAAEANSEMVFTQEKLEERIANGNYGDVTAADIIETAAKYRRVYQSLIEAYNLVVAPKMGLSQINERADYFHHMRDYNRVDIRKSQTKPGFNVDGIGSMGQYISQITRNLNEYPLAQELYSVAKLLQKEGKRELAKAFEKQGDVIMGKAINSDKYIIEKFEGKPLKRKVLKWAMSLNSTSKTAIIVGNLSSLRAQALNNNLAMAHILKQAETPEELAPIARGITRSLEQGMALAIKNITGVNMFDKVLAETSALHERSTFLQTRTVNELFTLFKEKGTERAVDRMSQLIEITDYFFTTNIWNMYYETEIARNGGDVDAAVSYADEWTRKASAGRYFGDKPAAYSTMVSKVFLPFTLEVNNQIQFAKDIMVEAEQNGDNVTYEFAKFMAAFSAIAPAVALIGGPGGFNPVEALFDAYTETDDEDDDENTFANPDFYRRALGYIAGEIISAFPKGQYAVGTANMVLSKAGFDSREVFGQRDPTRFQTGGNFPVVRPLQAGAVMATKGAKAIGTNEPEDWGAFGMSAVEAASTIIPGGNQLRKSIGGLEAANIINTSGPKPPFPASMTKQGDKLRTPLPDDLGTTLRAVGFGEYDLPEVEKFFASGRRELTESQTQGFFDVYKRYNLESYVDYMDLYEAFYDLKKMDGRPSRDTVRERMNQLGLPKGAVDYIAEEIVF